MVIPEQFNLMAHVWKVEHVQGMVIAPDGDECKGLCDYDSLTIKINVTLAPSLVAHTFFHEVMHAILWTLGNKLGEDEPFVDSIGGALAQVSESLQYPCQAM